MLNSIRPRLPRHYWYGIAAVLHPLQLITGERQASLNAFSGKRVRYIGDKVAELKQRAEAAAQGA